MTIRTTDQDTAPTVERVRVAQYTLVIEPPVGASLGRVRMRSGTTVAVSAIVLAFTILYCGGCAMAITFGASSALKWVLGALASLPALFAAVHLVWSCRLKVLIEQNPAGGVVATQHVFAEIRQTQVVVEQSLHFDVRLIDWNDRYRSQPVATFREASHANTFAGALRQFLSTLPDDTIWPPAPTKPS